MNKLNIILTYIKKTCVPKQNLVNMFDIKQIKTTKYDHYNNVQNGIIDIIYFDNLTNEHIGQIIYRLNGQIGSFYINSPYRSHGLGKQILLETINELKKHNVKYIFAVTIKDHYFWSNVFNKKFIWCNYNTLHPSITGSGYKMNI
jgi:hypothetical protein